MQVHVVSGTIVSRRSIGQSLAFAEIDATEPPSHHHRDVKARKSIKVKFNRQSFLGAGSPSDAAEDGIDNERLVGDGALDDLFPTKKSSLPYGAKVKVQLGNCTKKSGAPDDCCIWEVLRWKITHHPKDLAEKLASLEIAGTSVEGSSAARQQVVVGNGAMSCSTYLKIRRQQFDQVHNEKKQQSHHLNGKAQIPERIQTNNTMTVDEFCHGGKRAKAKRAKVFAAWVLETFFGMPFVDESFCRPCNFTTEKTIAAKTNYKLPTEEVHIFDIAGGKGHLSLELVLQQMLRRSEVQSHHISKCTIIDPVVRKGDAKMRHSKLQKLKGTAPMITHLATCFEADFFENKLIDSQNKDAASEMILVGLHPDQCTESIVDAALQSGSSFAVVPCCVYPDLFPNRHYWVDGKLLPVRTYDEFLKYLMQKDNGIKMSTLPIEGKNVVLYKDCIGKG